MQWRRAATVFWSFSAGVVVAWLLNPGADSRVTSVTGNMEQSATGVISNGAASPDARYVRRIAELESQNEYLRQQAAPGAGVNSRVMTAEEAKQRIAERVQRANDAREEDRIASLRAAGFQSDRIAWLRKRTEELGVEFRQKDDRQRQQGRFDLEDSLKHLTDCDIELRYEIGDHEYARYREAVGRGTGMRIGGVVKGGIGESIGLRPGDEIIAYNGVRVFNIGELMPLMSKYATSGTFLSVDVQREGRVIRLSAPPGNLRVQGQLIHDARCH